MRHGQWLDGAEIDDAGDVVVKQRDPGGAMLGTGFEELVAGSHVEHMADGDAHLTVALAADYDDQLRIWIALHGSEDTGRVLDGKQLALEVEHRAIADVFHAREGDAFDAQNITQRNSGAALAGFDEQVA